MQQDLNYATAHEAIRTLNAINVDTTPATEPLARWDRVRDAVKSGNKADPAPLWVAIADGDQKAIDKAAVAYMTASAIQTAAKADGTREHAVHADTMAAIKRLVLEAQDGARDLFNEAAAQYTDAFHAAGGRPDPSVLIVSEGGSKLWQDLISAAQTMNRAAAVFKLGSQFGHGVADQKSGLKDQVPYVTGLPTITAVEQARHANDWLNTPTHAPHRAWATFVLAGGELHAGDLYEQADEVERLIEGAQAKRRMPRLADMMSADEKAMARATKKALRSK